jgi:hypothetical protein
MLWFTLSAYLQYRINRYFVDNCGKHEGFRGCIGSYRYGTVRTAWAEQIGSTTCGRGTCTVPYGTVPVRYGNRYPVIRKIVNPCIHPLYIRKYISYIRINTEYDTN